MILKNINKSFPDNFSVITLFGSFWMPLILTSLAIWDLRIEIKLLVENFTFISLTYAIYRHPLAIIVLILVPKMIDKNNK